jgi:hypothetical protein
LPDDADDAMHEDFVAWDYGHDTLREIRLITKHVKQLLEDIKKRDCER